MSDPTRITRRRFDTAIAADRFVAFAPAACDDTIEEYERLVKV